MTDAQIQKTKTSWINTVLKILFFVITFFLIIFTVLFNLGGANDIYKQTIEQYITESTGYAARINKFNAMTFFPDLGVDFENLELRLDPADTDPVAGADRVSLSFGFWDAAFSTGKINTIYIENFYALPGAVLGRPVQIQRAGIINTGDGTAVFRIEGHIGEHAAKAETDILAYGSGPSAKYKFGRENKFSLDIGEAHAEGVIRGRDDGAVLDGFKAMLGKEEVLSGSFNVTGERRKNMQFNGEWKLPEYGTVLNPDLKLEFTQPRMAISGRFASPDFYIDDFKESSRLKKLVDYMDGVFTSDMPSRVFTDNHVDLSVQNLHAGTDNSGPLEKTFQSENSPLTWKSIRDFIAALPGELQKPSP